MNYTTHLEEAVGGATDGLETIPANFLNAYDIVNAAELAWLVNIYAVDLKGDQLQGHDARGKLRDVIWKLRFQRPSVCKGEGFVVDLSPRLVAVPARWTFPVPINTGEYSVSLERCHTASTSDNSDRPIVEGILRDAIKLHFKSSQSDDLGPLWQDYNAFCQYPTESGDEYLMCRRFECSAKALKGGRWVVQVRITTATIDGKTFQDYYRLGEVHVLAERLVLRYRNR